MASTSPLTNAATEAKSTAELNLAIAELAREESKAYLDELEERAEAGCPSQNHGHESALARARAEFARAEHAAEQARAALA